MTTSITSASALLGPLGGRMDDHVSGHHFYIEHPRSFGSVAAVAVRVA
jgi:hypothetical protein